MGERCFVLGEIASLRYLISRSLKDPALLVAHIDRAGETMKAVVLNLEFVAQLPDGQSSRLTEPRANSYFSGKGRSSMRFVRHLTGLPERPSSSSGPTTNTTWRTERSGSFGGYAVSGWRYIDLAIWHVMVWSIGDDKPGQTFVVSAGEFYPQSVTPAEKFAALRLISFWEVDSFR
jgi:hypothetical protein